MISPASNTLFQNAILMSGSALNPYLPYSRHSHKSILYNLGRSISFRWATNYIHSDVLYFYWLFVAENLHYPISDDDDLLEFLREIDAKLLYKMSYQKAYLPGFGRKSFNRIWTVCIEGLVEFNLKIWWRILSAKCVDLFVITAKNAFEPFLTESPFSILSNENYSSNINTLYSTSPWVRRHTISAI